MKLNGKKLIHKVCGTACYLYRYSYNNLTKQFHFSYVWNRLVKYGIFDTSKEQEIYLNSTKCQYSDDENEKRRTACQHIIKKDSAITFSDIDVNRITTISLELSGSEGQMIMWSTKKHRGEKIHIFPASNNSSIMKFVLNDVYQHDMLRTCVQENNFCSISVLFVFPNEDSCVQSINPKVYISNSNDTMIFLGSSNLQYVDLSTNQFKFEAEGNLTFKEAFVSSKGYTF